MALDSRKLHALIIGVSNYPNLTEHDAEEEPPAHHLGLRRLTSAATAAHRMFAWLKANAAALVAPIGYCKVLLSPSNLEAAAGLADVAKPATLENFELFVNAWRDAARQNRDSIALFYFAGHGLLRNTAEKAQVLLLEEFGNTPHKILKAGVEMSNVFNGMASLSALDEMARTQLYFIDACRTLPGKVATYEELQGQLIWDISKPDPANKYTDKRLAPVIYTSEPGESSCGIYGEGSVFGEALMACLNGGAGEYDALIQRWVVSLASLTAALPKQLQAVNRKYETNQMVRFSDTGPDALLRTLDKAPLVDLTITVEPDVSRALTEVSVTGDDDISVLKVPAPFPDVHHDQVAAGNYTVTAQGVKSIKRLLTAKPPSTPWLLQV